MKLFSKYAISYQLDAMDCGAACLSMLSNYFGVDYSTDEFKDMMYGSREGVSLLEISEIAEKTGFRTRGVRVPLAGLVKEITLPCILHWRENHFVVLYKIRRTFSGRKYLVADPAAGKVWIRENEFCDNWFGQNAESTEKGILLTFEPTPAFYEKRIGTARKKLGIRYVLRYLYPYKRFLVQLFIGLVVGSLLQLIFPFLTQSIVDVGINFKNIDFVYLVLIGQVFFIFTRLTVEMLRRWILLHISTRINISIISDFLVKLMKLPIGYFDTKMIGDILQRIKDHERIENFLTSSTLSILFSAVNIFLFGGVLFYYSPLIFVVFLVGSLLYVTWITLFMKRRKEIDYQKFQFYAQNQSSQLQLISGIQEIKLNNCETRKRWEWEHIQAKLFKASLKGLKLEQVQTMGGTMLNELKNVLIAFLAAKAVIDGNITIGMMLAIQYINGQLNGPISNLIEFAYSFQNAKIALERLQDVHLKQDEEERNKGKLRYLPASKDIVLSNVSFRFGDPHAKKAINNLSLIIPEGKTTAIVGVSGSGKTTLIKLLLGFYQPEEGTIQIGGTPLNEFNSRFWRENCGAVMQDGFIFSDTLYRNIAPAAEEVDEKRIQYATEVSNLNGFIKDLPLKFNTKIGNEGVGISQGQRQRVLIARVVYKNPEFIFFDEATNALDAENEKNIVHQLSSFFKKKTVIIVAHRLSTVKNADQILVLDNGQLVEMGNHEELVQQEGKYYNLVKDQLELNRYEYK